MANLAINGGPKACDVAWPSWPIWGDAERTALNGVLESGEWFYGEKVREFEAAFAAFQDARFGVAAANGSVALEAALQAMGIGRGDEVIVPPYTFVATASSVVRVGAVPIFGDIEGDTLCLDPEDVANRITDRTRAIMPVHMAGYVADMDRFQELCTAHDLRLIEDACHSWGSQWNGKGTGALGDCGVFSFQASKNITAGEGGIILTDDEETADACRSFTNMGRIKGGAWYEHHVAGSNFRLTEFQAAILLAQLTRLEAQTLQREANARILDEALGEIPGIISLRPDERMTRRSYHLYTFRLDEAEVGVSRDRFAEALEAEGVPAYAGYVSPLYRNPFFLQWSESPVDYAAVRCPTCEQVCRDTVWIRHPALLADEAAMQGIAAAIRKVCEHVAELQ